MKNFRILESDDAGNIFFEEEFDNKKEAQQCFEKRLSKNAINEQDNEWIGLEFYDNFNEEEISYQILAKNENGKSYLWNAESRKLELR